MQNLCSVTTARTLAMLTGRNLLDSDGVVGHNTRIAAHRSENKYTDWVDGVKCGVVLPLLN
jgi:hypothetical protein